MTDPTRDIVSGEEHAIVKRQLARVEAVLADLLNERRGTNALQVEMLAWLRNPEAVHGFMNVDPIEYNEGGDRVCRFCDHLEGGHYYEEGMECDLLKLWRILEDERYQKTMDSMFESWCRAEEYRESQERNAEIGRRRRGVVNIVGSPYVRDGEAYMFQDNPRCSCAGGSPRAEPDSRPHEPTCPLRIAAERQTAAVLNRYRARHGLDGSETPLFTPGRTFGVDLGAGDDRAAVVVGHVEDGKLVIDTETIVK